LEIPPGATDNSQPAPAGAYNHGQVLVTGIDVPAGSERIVRFSASPSQQVYEIPVMSNQAFVTSGQTPADPGQTWPTDDGATQAFEDDTRVFFVVPQRSIAVHAYWHANVDIDLRVIDPCT